MSLKRFVNTPEEWKEFTDKLDELIQAEYKLMESQENSLNLHRSQGKIKAYKRLKALRDELNGSNR